MNHLNDFYELLARDTAATKAYLLYAVAILSLWLSRKTLYWSIFWGMAITAALVSDRMNLTGLFWVLLTGLFFFAYYRSSTALTRLMFAVPSVVLAAGLMAHWLPGFNNWKIFDQLQIGSSSERFSLFLNFDKPLLAWFIVGFGGLSLGGRGRWKHSSFYGLALGVLAAVTVLGGASVFGLIEPDMKLSEHWLLWGFNNLIFVCVAEEALFRGFIQEELRKVFPSRWWPPVLIAGILFGLAHWAGGIEYVLASSLAGVFYGLAFYKSRRIEASILCHFVLNFVHFVFFTYPR